MEKITVLVVDDHTIMREGIRSLLSAYDDIEIIGEATDGKAAIEKATELVPDVVLMDIAMPGMDGLEATRNIRAQVPETKVIMLTQYDDKEYTQLSHQIGAAGYVPKRALAKELVSVIRAVQERHSFLYSLLQVQR